MDKKEFYRQLMETYTVDTDRVKRNAMRKSRNVKSKALVIRNWTVAAAACCAVTAAAVAVVSLSSVPHIDPSEGYDITDGGVENARARMAEAEQQYAVFAMNENNEERADLYISFLKPLKYDEIAMALSVIEDYSDITISLLYLENGTHYENNSSLDYSSGFSGAKISAPISMISEIRILKEVIYIEYPESGITDDSFVPLTNVPADITTTPASVSDNINVSIPEATTTAAPITVTETETSTETAETTVPAETTGESTEEGTDTTDITETAAPEQSGEQTSEPVGETGGETDVPVTDPTETDVPAEPVFETITVPLSGIKTINFISKDHFVATTADSIRLFGCYGSEIKLETTYYVSSAKISYSSYDGSRLFIIARDGDNRTRLYYADGEASLLSEVDVSYITSGGAELSTVSCSGDGKTVLMKAVTLDKTIVYYGERSEGTISLANKEYSSPVSVLAYNDGVVYTAVTNSKENTVTIFSIAAADNTETQLASYVGTLKYTRSPDLNMALLTITNNLVNTPEASFILNNGQLIPVNGNEAVFSGERNDLVRIGGIYYTVADGQLTEVPEEEARPYFETVSGSGYEISESGEASIIVQVG